LGNLNVRNALMSDFTGLMQSVVLDRPVVDQTGLTGRFDFTLNWTPDDSQFGGMGARIPPPTDSADAPPNLYTAIQEQIGLKAGGHQSPRRRYDHRPRREAVGELGANWSRR